MSEVQSFRDLRVYQQLKDLHFELHKESLQFPKFELYELGSQIRRASNAAPAIVAEGWGSRHTNIYLEAINRSLGEIRETQHHLDVARENNYITAERFAQMDESYNQCGRMLERLYEVLGQWRGSTRTTNSVRENTAEYVAGDTSDWRTAMDMTLKMMEEFK
ncbi:MAG: four helix bundle protein [Lentisphaerae bacterium]|nr:four helix bundle protein [Lentisphaerota bacterium]